MSDSYYVRRLSSYKKEAAAALRHNWGRAYASGLALLLIVAACMLPSWFSISSASLSVSSTSLSDAETLFMMPSGMLWSTLLLFLFAPIATLGLNRLSMNLLSKKPIRLSFVMPTFGEWFKSIRVSIVGWFWACWPFMLGIIALTSLLPILAPYMGSAEEPNNLLLGLTVFLCLGLYALMIYSITRSISYMPAQYLLVMESGLGARDLLRASRVRMKGRKGRLFLLSLSFIGWIYLAMLAPMLVSVFSASLLDGVAATSLAPYFVFTGVIFLTTLSLLPVFLYMNTSIAAFVREMSGENTFVLPQAPEAPAAQADSPEATSAEDNSSEQ